MIWFCVISKCFRVPAQAAARRFHMWRVWSMLNLFLCGVPLIRGPQSLPFCLVTRGGGGAHSDGPVHPTTRGHNRAHLRLHASAQVGWVIGPLRRRPTIGHASSPANQQSYKLFISLWGGVGPHWINQLRPTRKHSDASARHSPTPHKRIYDLFLSRGSTSPTISTCPIRKSTDVLANSPWDKQTNSSQALRQ